MGAKGFRGVAPRMTKLFTGRGKTRPIPRVVDSSDIVAAAVVNAEQTPRSRPAEKVLGPRPAGGAVFGTKVSNGKGSAGTYSPGSGFDNI